MAFDRNEAADVAFGHRPVLLDECMEGLAIRPGGIYLDGTLGRAGHSWEIVRRLNAGGRLIGLDRDETALEAARQRLAPYADRVTLVHSNFSRVAEVLDELGVPAVDGMLFDLGVSSPQLDDAQRGFSYMHDAPLDMRMDRTAGLTARTVVNEWPYEELRRILYEYGEERYAPAIARRIVAAREEAPIETTGQLVDLIKSAMPPQALREKQHPAKRSFQALRIAVNGELEELTAMLRGAASRLAPGGRLAVTFPKSVGQIPFAFPFKPGSDSRGIVRVAGALYPFGHGLSYTTFEYSGLDISVEPDSVKVRFDIANTGQRAGDEVAQLYVSDDVSSATTYVKQLRGFERVSLEPGEKKRVEFALSHEDISLVDDNGTYTLEPGDFTITVGSSSADARLTGKFSIE